MFSKYCEDSTSFVSCFTFSANIFESSVFHWTSSLFPICSRTLTVHCLLFPVVYSLFAVHCWLFPVGCWLLCGCPVSCLLIRCSLFTVHFSLFTVHSSPFTVHCSMFIFKCSLFTAHSSPFAVCCSLFTAHHSLFIVYFSLFIFEPCCWSKFLLFIQAMFFSWPSINV